MGIPNARASIGTGIHAGAEIMWQNAMKTKEKDCNETEMEQAAIEAFDKECEKGLRYDEGEDYNSAVHDIRRGVGTFIDDIVPYTDIPLAVEQRFTMELDHPLIADLSGTVDYISHNAIEDIKTSKRTPTPANYVIQQSVYKILAEHNGHNIQHQRIQGVVLTKAAKGTILPIEPDVELAKAAVNSLLDTTEVFSKDIVHPEVLFRGNPKYYLCSSLYCAFYPCKFVKGSAKPAQQIPAVNL